MQRKWMAVVVVALGLAAAAGCADDKLVRFADLKDGDYVGGEEVTDIETDFTLRAISAELYVDGQLAAVAPLAPFQLVWDASPFEEGEHRLTLRVLLQDGVVVEDAIRVTVDNTPPVIHDLDARQQADASVSLPVEDNFALDRVEVESSLSPGKIAIGRGKTPIVAWPAGCGPARAKLVAFDRAGNSAERSFDVAAVDAKDSDCDGFRSTFFSGDDCDDFRAWVHPGAPEIIEGFDFSCDGKVARRDGVDFDNDGVLSISDGGDDCDDSDPLIHGGLMRHQRRPILRAGSPVSWQPGEAVVLVDGVILNRGGVIERIAPSLAGDSLFSELATGANPGSLAADEQIVVFGRGNDVVVISAITGAQLGVFTTSGPVGRLAHTSLNDGTSDLRVVTFQSGTKLWMATAPFPGAGPWNQRLVLDVGAPLIAPPVGSAGADSSRVNLRTAQKLGTVYLDKNGATREEVVGAPIANVTAALFDSSDFLVGVRNANGAGVLQDWFGAFKNDQELTFPKPITFIARHGVGLLVQLEDGQTFLLRQSPTLRIAQTLAPAEPISAANYQGFAGGGAFYIENNSISPAYRTGDAEKNRDSDCDGFRY